MIMTNAEKIKRIQEELRKKYISDAEFSNRVTSSAEWIYHKTRCDTILEILDFIDRLTE